MQTPAASMMAAAAAGIAGTGRADSPPTRGTRSSPDRSPQRAWPAATLLSDSKAGRCLSGGRQAAPASPRRGGTARVGRCLVPPQTGGGRYFIYRPPRVPVSRSIFIQRPRLSKGNKWGVDWAELSRLDVLSSSCRSASPPLLPPASSGRPSEVCMNAHALSSRRRPGTMRTHRSRRSSMSSEAAPTESNCGCV